MEKHGTLVSSAGTSADEIEARAVAFPFHAAMLGYYKKFLIEPIFDQLKEYSKDRPEESYVIDSRLKMLQTTRGMLHPDKKVAYFRPLERKIVETFFGVQRAKGHAYSDFITPTHKVQYRDRKYEEAAVILDQFSHFKLFYRSYCDSDENQLQQSWLHVHL